MSVDTAIRLIRSLSGPEKRYFRLHSCRQTGTRDYVQLFEIIGTIGNDQALVEKQFKNLFPKASIDNTARYLVRVITDGLIEVRMQKDNSFQLFQGLMRVKVLQERALPEKGYKELIRIRAKARQAQQPLMEYLTYRYELDYISNEGFRNSSDRFLVDTQMKAKELLKNINHVQDLHSLFEMMKYRLLHSGQILSDEDRKNLNDLILSEMTLMTGRMKNEFTANKLHLLFQSYFFTNVGEFQTALKTFRELNMLFEENIALLDHPPLDYLSTLDGILSSLRMLKRYDEIHYYVEKLQLLDQPAYSEFFRYQVRKSVLIAELIVLLSQGKYQEGADYLAGIDSQVLTAYWLVDEEKQWELYFYCSLAYFGAGNLKKSHTCISQMMNNSRMQPLLLVYRATRLLNIIIYYEKGESAYLEHEIRSYQRFFGKQSQLLKTEALVFKYLQLMPDKRRKKLPDVHSRKLLALAKQLKQDKYEQQLLQYFDFVGWVELRMKDG